MVQVLATREGKVGKIAASGWRVDYAVKAVALPSTHALGRHVRLRCPRNGHTCIAEVLDVGPWEEHDDAYVFGMARPRAEAGHDSRGRRTNGAGIDLSERVYFELQLHGNEPVQWEWLSEAWPAAAALVP